MVAVIDSKELRVDSMFAFLSRAGRELLYEILSRKARHSQAPYDGLRPSTAWTTRQVFQHYLKTHDLRQEY
jgi:hypothetical protein